MWMAQRPDVCFSSKSRACCSHPATRLLFPFVWKQRHSRHRIPKNTVGHAFDRRPTVRNPVTSLLGALQPVLDEPMLKRS